MSSSLNNTYPPTNSLTTALNPTTNTINTTEFNQQQESINDSNNSESLTQKEIHENHHTLALRGGCLDLSSCGCPCEICCIPCSIM